jgi:glutaredoxin
MQTLILYSKPGCHLCEGLQEKLEQLQDLGFELEIRDITSQPDWFQAYQYEVPVLFRQSTESPSQELPIPRPSPRLTVNQLRKFLQPFLSPNRETV